MSKKDEKVSEAKAVEKKPATATKTLKEKPELPSVQHLLQFGAEQDPNAEPETFLQSLVMPGLLLVTFLVSLALFHYATDGFKGGNHGRGTEGPAYRSRYSEL